MKARLDKRAALTLMELVVVLVILIALASVVVPMFPNMLTRAHTSSAATNVQEVSKSIGTYEQLFTQFPDGWDSLTVGNALATYVPNPTITVGGAQTTYLTTRTLAAADQMTATLASSGIQNVYNFVATPSDPTFNPYSSDPTLVPTPTNIAVSGGTLAVLTPAGAQKLNLDPTATHVVLGYGKKNTMVGKTAVDAPVHFADSAGGGPNVVYGRFGVVFKVSSGTSGGFADTALPRAIQEAVIDFSADDGIASIGDHIQEYYKAVNGSK